MSSQMLDSLQHKEIKTAPVKDALIIAREGFKTIEDVLSDHPGILIGNSKVHYVYHKAIGMQAALRVAVSRETQIAAIVTQVQTLNLVPVAAINQISAILKGGDLDAQDA